MSIYPKYLVFVIFCVLYLFGISSRGLSPSGYPLERQSSLGEVIPGGNATRMSYLYSIDVVLFVVSDLSARPEPEETSGGDQPSGSRGWRGH